jgi:hypothetical protein
MDRKRRNHCMARIESYELLAVRGHLEPLLYAAPVDNEVALHHIVEAC